MPIPKIRFSLLGLPVLLVSNLIQAATCETDWPHWQKFAERWIQNDGRVLESSLLPNHSTSEGQAYALFFALIGNDKTRFEKIWRWTKENLSGSAPEKQLPAWLWGKGKDGKWKAQDSNSASDADLWFAYALLEADRLWAKPNYRADAEHLLENIKAQEIVELPGLGVMLLPGAKGFSLPDYLWRLNPSYLPLSLLRRLEQFEPDGPWKALAKNTIRLLEWGHTHGFAADWVGYRGTSKQNGLFVTDAVKGDLGSYDAIRVYLWAGMTDSADPLATKALANLGGMAEVTASNGIPPEKVTVKQGHTEGVGSFGFSAALIPYFRALNQPWLADLQYRRANAGLEAALAGERDQKLPPVYYDYMLSLFGLGWADKRYRFDAEGKVHTFWESPCSIVSH